MVIVTILQDVIIYMGFLLVINLAKEIKENQQQGGVVYLQHSITGS